MKSFISIFALFVCLNNIVGQNLPSLSETIKYLEIKESQGLRENLNYNKDWWIKYEEVYARYGVDTNGLILRTTSYVEIKEIYKESNSIRATQEAYASDLYNMTETSSDEYQRKYRGFVMHCKPDNKECVKWKVYKGYELANEGYSNDFGIAFTPEYKEQIKNAFEHLVNLSNAKADIFKKHDTDPFSNINYKKSMGLGPIIVPVYKSESGLYSIDLNIGGKTVRGYIDSGASNILISTKLLNELILNKYVDSNQIISYAQIANGDIVAAYTHNAPVVSINGEKVLNITVCALDNISDILIGQSFLSQFKKWEIDNDNNTLTLER